MLVQTARAQELRRPGDAAGLLGNSTVLADLDADHQTDIATAHRFGRNGYGIEVHLSHGSSVNFGFTSAQQALTLRATDLDHDRDLDLVVSQPLSKQPIRVWINDGAGRFDERDGSAYADDFQSDEEIASRRTPTHSSISGIPPRSPDRIAPALVSPVRVILSHTSARPEPTFDRRRSGVSQQNSSRAPPAPIL